MCGIVGILNFENDREVDKSKLMRMADVINHRGPDGEGFYFNKNIGFGHKRLSIIDLETGFQPMFNKDKSIVLIFNGEIYNYIELKEELKSLGHVFYTNSDTEVIIKSYEQWGFTCQNKFNGMWAFALWDNNNQLLFLSRDRLGEKPLFYSVYDNAIIFSSEIKSLFEYGIPKSISYEMLEIYLVLNNIPFPYTFFKDIKKLKPGHFILAKTDKIDEKKYWDLPDIDEKNMLTNKKSIYDKFSELLYDSVKLRMRSDVPYGAFLSGGLDSSAIVTLMSEISSHKVKTFTIGYENNDFDESKLAKEFSSKFETEHYWKIVQPENFNETLQRIIFHYDEPFADPSAIPTGYVSEFAHEKVKMVLTGDGGDEILSGYNTYQSVKFTKYYQLLPGSFQSGCPKLIGAVSKLFRNNNRYKLNRIENILYTSSLPFNQFIINKHAYTDLKIIKYLSRGINNKISIEEYISDFMQNCPYQDMFYKLMFFNLKYDLPNDYLVKVDRMSMAYSLETRIPFLDHRLIEYMIQVDKNIKMQGWERKSILRGTIGKQLPQNILNSPKKGFGIPLRDWFKDEKLMKHLSFTNLNQILDPGILNNIKHENLIGIKNNGNFIWNLLVLNKIFE